MPNFQAVKCELRSGWNSLLILFVVMGGKILKQDIYWLRRGPKKAAIFHFRLVMVQSLGPIFSIVALSVSTEASELSA